MDSDIKDTLEVIIPNAGAIGLSITDCNEYLTFISLVLAISISLFKLYNWKFKKKTQSELSIREVIAASELPVYTRAQLQNPQICQRLFDYLQAAQQLPAQSAVG